MINIVCHIEYFIYSFHFSHIFKTQIQDIIINQELFCELSENLMEKDECKNERSKKVSHSA